MDFSNRSSQPQGPAPAPAAGGKKRRDDGKLKRIGIVVAGAAVVILIIGVILALAGSKTKPESEYVDSSKLQAVFLNTGQVYFGNVTSLNSDYTVLTNIYYLQTTNNQGANANANVTLVKLGCELHEPFDKMVINSEQVTFWENLQDGGQVAKAVATFEKQNPNGQKCADQSSSASNNSASNAQNANNGNTGNGGN